ncbi:hypothetical protein PUN28_005534 [Cardiocondyla obscurior]|uniref:Uncharacterized protein n=1 Tax=Cardiocondyla obscurior TaxID=286306 RepID=A0AAW2GJN2_9HYME
MKKKKKTSVRSDVVPWENFLPPSCRTSVNGANGYHANASVFTFPDGMHRVMQHKMRDRNRHGENYIYIQTYVRAYIYTYIKFYVCYICIFIHCTCVYAYIYTYIYMLRDFT